MRRAPPPIHNALQQYLRTLFSEATQPTASGQSCLRTPKLQSRSLSTPKKSLQRHSTASDVRPTPGKLRSSLFVPRRCLATVRDLNREDYGPLKEYDDRVHNGRLREDSHQRTIVENLQDLYETLSEYNPPEVAMPSADTLKPQKSFFSSLFGGGSTQKPQISQPYEKLPKGLYMYGDVGSGKTMLMDLFFDNCPPNITHKTRIHFHNFMQDVHKRLHKTRIAHAPHDIDAVPIVAAEIAQNASLLCFDEFQCTDVADAMILRRLIQSLMSHGVVIVTTSNRHPDDLYKNGIQRESFIPCINLLKKQLRVINLDSNTDYRKIPRPPSGVYHHPLDRAAVTHANKWFSFLGDPENDPPHPSTISVWGRDVEIPSVSGTCARFTFHDLIGRACGAADYIEMCRHFSAFVVTDVPGMTFRQRDWARRFITFLDAAYESHAKLVLTTQVPLGQLFMSKQEVEESLSAVTDKTAKAPDSTSKEERAVAANAHEAKEHGSEVDDVMRNLMDDLGLTMGVLKQSSLFSGDEERFAFARALSRLSEMGSQDWIERGLGLEHKGGLEEKRKWSMVRSRRFEDSM